MNRAISMLYLSSCVILGVLIAQSDGHGRLLDPPGRSSLWRFGFNTPINYDDNQLFCGGYDVQWHQNGGKCGICGDPFNGRRENEAGGKYATGTISRHYTEGETISVTVEVTTNHGGFFEFKLCPNNNPRTRATELCLNQYLLRQPNGQTKWNLPTGTRKFSLSLVLPRGLTCTQCVMQWKWTTASNWDCDVNNHCCKGCGPQETFMGCSDISITSSRSGSAGGASEHVSGIGSLLGGASETGGGSVPIGAPGAGSVIPAGSSNTQQCEATAAWKLKYPYANQWCQTQCPTGNCPIQYCADACRRRYG